MSSSFESRRDRSAVPVFVNGRFSSRSRPTGVDRLAAEFAASRPEGVLRPKYSGVIGTNLWEQSVLPVRARTGVLLSLANSGPMVARRHVVAIHDMAHWDHPEWFSRAYVLKARTLNRSWARAARLILCPSRSVAGNIVRRLGRSEETVVVVGNGHRWSDLPAAAPPDREQFALVVGTLSTRKNLAALLAAWPAIRHRYPALRLRVVGATGGRLFADGVRPERIDGVDVLGYVDDSTLDHLYAHASVFIAPSLYEGFDIPVLDALTVGTPVVASDIDVHRELFADVAALVDPANTIDLADAVTDAIGRRVDEPTRRALLREHSWERVTARVDAALERIS